MERPLWVHCVRRLSSSVLLVGAQSDDASHRSIAPIRCNFSIVKRGIAKDSVVRRQPIGEYGTTDSMA